MHTSGILQDGISRRISMGSTVQFSDSLPVSNFASANVHESSVGQVQERLCCGGDTR